jgi:hypothetical protein
MENLEKKILPDYNGHYLVYSNGIVKSLINNKLNKRENPYILKQKFDKYGYLTVCLSNKCYSKPVKVHRIVAKTFIDNPYNYPVVNHINGIKSDNRVENLEWCTPEYNTEHAKLNGLIKSGADCAASKKIIDKNSGKIYVSITELWNNLNLPISYTTLRRQIKSGNSNFDYCN